MKKLSVFGFLLAAVFLFGCKNAASQSATADLKPMIMVDGTIYLDTGKQISAEIAPDAVIGEITSSKQQSEKPEKNSESNFGNIGAKYACCEDGLAVLINNEWQLFKSEDGTLPQAAENRISLTFPAYELNGNEPAYIAEQSNFYFSVTLPAGWSLSEKYNNELLPMGELYTPMYIYDGDEIKGYIGFDCFEPYSGEIPEEEYYMSVYPKLRLSRFSVWDPYTAVKTTENGEVGTVEISYLDYSRLNEFAGRLPDMPEYKSNGILCYDKALCVYVGIAFVPDAVSDEELNSIAESVVISDELS